MSILIKNIKELVQIVDKNVDFVAGPDMAKLNNLKNAWLFIKDGWIADFGVMSDYQESLIEDEDELIELDA